MSRSHAADDADGGAPRPARARLRWPVVGALVVALGWCWSVATPLMSSPDEPSHVVRAAGVVRGQISLPDADALVSTAEPGVAGIVRLPSDYAASIALPNCFAFQQDVPASCQPDLPPPGDPVDTRTYAGQYPPLYYALVGWPSLLLPAESGILAMRLLSALLSGLLVTWGLYRLSRIEGNRAGVWGAAVALTPMCFFLGATVNPAGFEISAAFAFWAACLALVLSRGPVGNGALLQAVVAGALLVNTRSTGPVWALAVVVVVLIAAPPGRWRAVVAHPRFRWYVAATVAASAAAIAWLLTHPSVVTTKDLYPQFADPRVVVLAVVGKGSEYLLNMIGDYGWLDAPSPPVTFIAWYAMVGAVLLLAFSAARPARRRGALLVLVLGVALAPAALQVPTAVDVGMVWQGRYALPLAVGVPLLAALVVGVERTPEGQLLRRVARGAVPVVLVGHVAAFYWASRRYAEGLNGQVVTLQPDWASPIGYLTGTALYAALATALAWFAWYSYRPAGGTVATVDDGPVGAHRDDAPDAGAEEVAVGRTAADGAARRPPVPD
ncbi:DUF2142 domain-containing protein [Cellulomonas xiejunii]|uniref:DUF2142 domain-containing protein n=1 Tax=Cellulomonas xiejunii TaxID=2968083 RepID=A0ABY5KJ48_9CELL|nr:DUF2142 domain-containing protein [Cellulomonas xiejunii]MCC2312933.1 DUF2142 domain-containing protein [Cellulomonas xiejunii]MCC2320197.1 DUF2142 domain-containing protein [Cellulomonas xiejunii]UUI70504.1 DUF2142 domain-containing protein [Cellulomonas xiejunii]